MGAETALPEPAIPGGPHIMDMDDSNTAHSESHVDSEVLPPQKPAESALPTAPTVSVSPIPIPALEAPPTPPTTSGSISSPQPDRAFIPSPILTPSLTAPTTPSLTAATESTPGTPTTVGFKRTASGAVKGGTDDESTVSGSDTKYEEREGEKRRVVDPSKIAELSTNLRTRLTYALLKLQNGWEKHTLDQVEELASQASQQGSPMSTTTIGGARRNSMVSSPSRVRGLAFRRGSESVYRRDLSSEEDEDGMSITERSREGIEIPTTPGGHRTYESFWRKHPPAHSLSRSFPEQASYLGGNGSQHSDSQYGPTGTYVPSYNHNLYQHSSSTLAPPAPIFSRRHMTTQPPLLRRDTSTLSTTSTLSNFSVDSVGSMGSVASSTGYNSVTGEDDLEREAVKGLMWLASPVNRVTKRGAGEDSEGGRWKRREGERVGSSWR